MTYLEATLTRVGPKRREPGPDVGRVKPAIDEAAFVLVVPRAQLAPSLCALLPALFANLGIAFQWSMLVVGQNGVGCRLGRLERAEALD
ncbi:hypothetical protein P5W98_36025 (plasmid) [Paraburkholderia sp. A1BS-2L]|nr:hypothetical protein [Paraburkholderia hospita]